jgi:exo-beta-1,3-glucanase (GH17 family)
VTSGSSVTSTSSSTLTSASTSTSTSVSFSSGSCSSAHEFGSDIEMQPQTFTEAMSRVSYRALLGEMCRSTCPP